MFIFISISTYYLKLRLIQLCIIPTLLAPTATSLKGHIDGMDSTPVTVLFSHQPGEALKEDQEEAL